MHIIIPKVIRQLIYSMQCSRVNFNLGFHLCSIDSMMQMPRKGWWWMK